MFLRRQDIIDKFDANFRSDENGQMYFWPKRAVIGLPITFEEYDAVTQAFERKHIFGMAVMWLAQAVGLGFAFYQVFARDNFGGAMLSLGAAFLFSALLMTRDQIGLLLPFHRRLKEHTDSILTGSLG